MLCVHAGSFKTTCDLRFISLLGWIGIVFVERDLCWKTNNPCTKCEVTKQLSTVVLYSCLLVFSCSFLNGLIWELCIQLNLVVAYLSCNMALARNGLPY